MTNSTIIADRNRERSVTVNAIVEARLAGQPVDVLCQGLTVLARRPIAVGFSSSDLEYHIDRLQTEYGRLEDLNVRATAALRRINVRASREGGRIDPRTSALKRQLLQEIGYRCRRMDALRLTGADLRAEVTRRQAPTGLPLHVSAVVQDTPTSTSVVILTVGRKAKNYEPRTETRLSSFEELAEALAIEAHLAQA